ncbi:elongation factor P maturation arginine rhamnosyltransferase EarP [Undibacterium sp. SXout7W]|uniref:elongation factor P maturation arginine rhamnosyltransferase EarP n=1 Tax=Undibacterium sp. SXout7W TaxID=3413049 RepID=UPI003BF04C81
MSSSNIPQTKLAGNSLALFCKVVDNYGDIGICWRLARQLQREHGIVVTLWVDDLKSFQRICPEVRPEAAHQRIAGVIIREWRDQDGVFTTDDIADIVIEFFGCDIPPAYIATMAICEPRPVWLNLEGLSAETWVEGCHTLPSPHPSYSLTKYFFFPGFNQKTGGLLIESDLVSQRQQFQSDSVAKQLFLKQFGVTQEEMNGLTVSLFCYPHAPVNLLFNVWQISATPVLCLIPEGVATETVKTWMGNAAHAGDSMTHGALTVRIIPFVPQPDYDKLLWACDLNFVRGEDSFVRAQWACKPFVWHIYPQDENLHHVKLKAFLECYRPATTSLHQLSLAWNGALQEPIDWNNVWTSLCADMSQICASSEDWQRQLLENGDLSTNLLKFAERVR